MKSSNRSVGFAFKSGACKTRSLSLVDVIINCHGETDVGGLRARKNARRYASDVDTALSSVHRVRSVRRYNGAVTPPDPAGRISGITPPRCRSYPNCLARMAKSQETRRRGDTGCSRLDVHSCVEKDEIIARTLVNCT